MKSNKQGSEEGKNIAVVGFGWYKKDEWRDLLKHSLDRKDMHDTYEEWEKEATTRFLELKEKGIDVHKIQITLSELLEWCEENKIPVNGSSKSRYIAQKVHQLYGNAQK